MKTIKGQDAKIWGRRSQRQSEEHIRLRISGLISSSRDGGYAAISKLLGRSHSYIQQYIKRRSPRLLRLSDRRLIARYFNLAESELMLPDEMPSSLALGSAAPESMVVDLETKSMPASTGFSDRWLEKRFGLQSEVLYFLTIEGDGMAPTLLHNDEVLVDRRDHIPSQDGLYILRIGGVECAKRITIHPINGTLVISSDNDQYASFENVRREDITIIGRVVWLARRLA